MFIKQEKSYERSMQIWSVLVGCAHNRQTITYKLLAGLIGMGAGTLSRPLGHVMRYCDGSDLPALTSLVVKKGGGKPGSGLETVPSGQMDKMREAVYRYEWYKDLPPTIKQLENS